MRQFTIFLLILVVCLAACGQSNLLPVGGELLFEERFAAGTTGSWQTEGDELGKTAISNEQLLIELNGSEMMQYSILSGNEFSDFVLSVEATQTAGPIGASYGVLFRMQDSQQFYRFEMTSDGLFMVERHNIDGSWSRLLPDWTESAAIKQGINTTNQLELVAEGTAFRFFINEQLVHEAVDGRYPQGLIGLDAGTFGQTGVQVAFDNLIISRP